MNIKPQAILPADVVVTQCPPRSAAGLTRQTFRVKGAQTKLPMPTSKQLKRRRGAR